MWKIATIAAFYFAKSSSLTCYNDEGKTSTCGDQQYCSIGYSTPVEDGDSAISQDCAPAAECTIFDAIDQCQYGESTVPYYSMECNGTKAVITGGMVDSVMKVECCNTDNCNSNFTTSTCTSNSDITTFNQLFSCENTIYGTAYGKYADSMCGDLSIFYTQSSCNFFLYEVQSAKCFCDPFVYLYGISTTDDEKTQLDTLVANLSMLLEAAYVYADTFGCSIMSECSLSSGFTYNISSFSFDITLSSALIQPGSITPEQILGIVASSINNYGYNTTILNTYISSMMLTSTPPSVTVSIQYSDMDTASMVQEGLSNNDITIGVGGMNANITSISDVMQMNYYLLNMTVIQQPQTTKMVQTTNDGGSSSSSSDGNMISFIMFNIIIGLFSLLY